MSEEAERPSPFPSGQLLRRRQPHRCPTPRLGDALGIIDGDIWRCAQCGATWVAYHRPGNMAARWRREGRLARWWREWTQDPPESVNTFPEPKQSKPPPPPPWSPTRGGRKIMLEREMETGSDE